MRSTDKNLRELMVLATTNLKPNTYKLVSDGTYSKEELVKELLHNNPVLLSQLAESLKGFAIQDQVVRIDRFIKVNDQ